MIAVLQVLHGSDSYIPALQAAFVPFMRNLFINGIEETQDVLRKIEIAGVCQLMENYPFDTQTLALLGHGIVLLTKISKKDVSTSWLGDGFLEVVLINPSKL